jgi:hypothetical protein
MAAIMDVVYSIILGGTILLIILNANDMASENHSLYNGDMLVQEMLITTAQMVEGEFRNMGFGVPQNQPTIVTADSSDMTFLCDLGRDGGFIDRIRYYVGPTSELNRTQNDLDRYLHRTVNGGSVSEVGVVTVFRLSYITQDGEVLPTPVPASRLGEIFVVEVTMEVQNPYARLRRESEVGEGERGALFSSSLWQQTRLASQNSRR